MRLIKVTPKFLDWFRENCLPEEVSLGNVNRDSVDINPDTGVVRFEAVRLDEQGRIVAGKDGYFVVNEYTVETELPLSETVLDVLYSNQ